MKYNDNDIMVPVRTSDVIQQIRQLCQLLATATAKEVAVKAGEGRGGEWIIVTRPNLP